MHRLVEIAANTVFPLIGFASICWLFGLGLKRSDDPSKILFKGLASLAVVIGEIVFVRSAFAGGNIGQVFLAAGSLGVCGLILRMVWASQLGSLLVTPLNMFEWGANPKPDYSAAIAKRKRNNPREAVVAIRRQMEKSPNDFEGVMLLASVQAEDLKDLRSADLTLNRFCEWEDVPPNQAAAALTQLADWHLKFYHDISSAKATLQRIVAKFPDTELAQAARERFADLDSAGKSGRKI
jgi:hypothetical protein